LIQESLEVSMFRKLLFVSCLLPATAWGGACAGQGCRYAFFGKDENGCLEIRNSGREDIQVTVYTAGSGAISFFNDTGPTEKVYKTSRTCVPAVDYVRADAKLEGGIFSPPTH